MRVELSKEAADRLAKMADEENVSALDMVEALIAQEHAKRELRRSDQ
jgi:hypothetical protein